MKSREGNDVAHAFSLRRKIQYAYIIISEQKNWLLMKRKCQNRCSSSKKKKGIKTEAKIF